MTPVCVSPTGCLLGEGPLWSPSDGLLWWVDIKRAKLHRYNPTTGNTRRYDLPLRASALAHWQGALLMIGDQSIGVFDPATEAFDLRAKLEGQTAGVRTNDAGVAPDGGLWFGTMDDAETVKAGRYFRLGSDLTVRPIALPDVLVTNTFQFAPDGRTFYTADSALQVIHAYDHDPATGALTGGRVFADVSELGGHPDGSAIDAEGCLWNAQWDGGRVVRYTPDGAIDQIIRLPVSRPTSCAFGGRDYKTLFITSARAGLGEAELDDQPLAGGLFALEVETPGLAPREFGAAR